MAHSVLPFQSSTCSHWLRLLIFAGLSIWLCAAHVVQADDSDMPATYRQLVSEALSSYEAGDFERAQALFTQAHEMWPNARTLRGLARVALDRQQYRKAIHYFEDAEAAKVQPLDAGLRQEAKELKQKALEALARVDVTISPAGATLSIDGIAQPIDLERPLLLDPGAHAVAAHAPGYRRAMRNVVLNKAEHAAWWISLDPLAQPAAAQSDRPAWLLPTGLSLAFVGAVGAGFGASSYGNYLDNGDKLRIPGNDEKNPAYRARWEDSRTRALVFSTLGLGVLSLGVAALAPVIPPRERRWVTPVLLIAGGAALASGLVIAATNGCTRSQDLPLCTINAERRDGGSLLAMLSAPLLSIPLVYAIEWLSKG